MMVMKVLGLISSLWQYLMVGVGLFYAYLWGRTSAKNKQLEKVVENVEKARQVRNDVGRVADPVDRLRRDWSRD